MSTSSSSKHPASSDVAVSRRRFFYGTTALAAASLAPGCVRAAAWRKGVRVSTFSADVTVPIGHGMMGGSWVAKRIADPLEAHGVVIEASGGRSAIVSVDWCEIRNEAYEAWQNVLADALGTKPEQVMISTVHQHDAPVADLLAERLLRQRGLAGSVCDPKFHEQALDRVGAAARASLKNSRVATHLGTGKATVRQLASNRRYVMPDGQVRFDRTSSTRNAFAIAADEGLVDPDLRTLSFWDGDTALAALSFYAVHPMSYYGRGDVSADFPGIARRRRQEELPGVKQIYCSGCSGNITAGKYNDGAPGTRAVLADRLHEAMAGAWKETRRVPLRAAEFRSEPVRFSPRSDAGFTAEDLEKTLSTELRPFQQCLAAMGLSWLRRSEAGRAISVPTLDFGSAQILLLPGESYVEFQIAAQQMRPDVFMCVAGYGDGATGYIPTDQHVLQGDPNLKDWCWVAPGAEARLLAAVRKVVRA
ncbi:MAG: hypothetical protein FJ405_06625 [Verrucomicrobia bacterium]|nr:hypothetical protein [Verrucomicrobiota bacterium]